MSTRMVTRCDCCRKEREFVPRMPDHFVRLQYSEYGEVHVCASCIAKNMARRMSRTTNEADRLALIDVLLRYDTPIAFPEPAVELAGVVDS